ncbi:hypothetical protein PILCRDRAFT_17526 [Piloderma croceum F 1598]|uniref:Uncharacterized protein n=1 Tax=Piloderma croceum (strain F 1598) TaxID=765440 RepID=A0A0C3AB26_PILCF|nr:hypothetical protein PILCRDRAFT_17526 [Piloderma croceum F 1598]
MNLDAITTVNDSLQQIQEVTYSWDDGLRDEDVYKACDELRSVCVCILTTLDKLLDKDEDGDGDSEDGIFDDEFVEESVIAETAGKKAACTTREHADSQYRLTSILVPYHYALHSNIPQVFSNTLSSTFVLVRFR